VNWHWILEASTQDELGTIKSHKVKLVIAADANPHFHCSRSLHPYHPYPLFQKEKIETELDRLEKTEVLKK